MLLVLIIVAWIINKIHDVFYDMVDDNLTCFAVDFDWCANGIFGRIDLPQLILVFEIVGLQQVVVLCCNFQQNS